MDFLTDGRLGSQIWLEREDSASRVRELVDAAAEVGIGQLRTFLMWPWIQAESPSTWDFQLFDSLFEAAAARGITIKATLTANSGPWWLGTASVLHSHTLVLDDRAWDAAEAYIAACASRYAGHPALGQWILWNEPFNRGSFKTTAAMRTTTARHEWATFLKERYGDIDSLNRRWRTGYVSFDDVQLSEDIAHPHHRDSAWRSFGPELADAEFRAQQLERQLTRIAHTVRESDPTTPLCVNPNNTLENHALNGYRLGELAGIVTVLGASFHAPWHFTFAAQSDHAALVTAGLSLLRGASDGGPVEVTELQTGNTFYAGEKALGILPSTVATTYLAPLLAGAESVTGWCFNTRSQDFEAGEWGLLDDLDQIGDRALALSQVRGVLSRLDEAIGAWHPMAAVAAVLVSEQSQAVELAIAEHSSNEIASNADVAIRGSALITAELNKLGVPADLVTLRSLDPNASLVVVANHIAWDNETADALLTCAAGGGTVIIDATSGQFDLDARLHRPWPGGLASHIGIRSRGLATDPAGDEDVVVNLNGIAFSGASNVRSALEFSDDSWSANKNLIFASDSQPVLWERRWGEGRILISAVPLAHSLVGRSTGRALVSYILELAAAQLPVSYRPLSAETSLFTVSGEHGHAVGIFAPHISRRAANIAVSIAPGNYTDLWADVSIEVGVDGIYRSDTPDGIALLVPAVRPSL